MRLAVPFAIVALALGLLAGCGSSENSSGSGDGGASAPQSESTAPAGASAKSCSAQVRPATALRATGVSCKQAQQLAAAWVRNGDCAPAGGASRSSCKLRGAYDCLAAVTDRGVAVSCARPGRSVAFTVKRG